MKRILMGGVLVSFAVCGAFAQRPATSVEVVHPSTSSSVVRPLTKVNITHPTTSVEVFHPSTQNQVFQPQTNVQTFHPTSQVQVIQPQTNLTVIHPQTNVEVVHPQTTVEVFHPQTSETVYATSEKASSGGQKGGKTGSSSQATTSMSDFKPMQAKNLSAKPSTEKAAPMGGGSMDLGNTTNEAEKDKVSKSSMLGQQAGASLNLNVDPKQNKLQGLDKLVTDRAKQKEK